MKIKLKSLFTILFAFGMLCNISVYAVAENNDLIVNTTYIKETFSAKLINELTGEEIILKDEETLVPVNLDLNGRSLMNNSITERTYDVTAKIPSEISLFASDTKIKESNGVKGSLTVSYDTRNMSTDPQINLKTVYGSWTQLDQWTVLDKRSVDYGVFPKSGHENPTSNSFSYSPGWGYVTWQPDTFWTPTGVNSSCRITTPGMGTSYIMQISIKLSY